MEFDGEAFEALGGTARSTRHALRQRPAFIEAAPADGVVNRAFGSKKAIDISGRHIESGRDIGDRGLGVTDATEMLFGDIEDAGARLVG